MYNEIWNQIIILLIKNNLLLQSYLHGNEVFANQMYFLSQMVLTEYS
jgi:hypothetical protein